MASKAPVDTTKAAPSPAETGLASSIFLLYSDPKFGGKTTQLLRTFCRALLIGRKDAIKPVAESACGFTPEPWQFIEGFTTLPGLVHYLSDTATGLRSAAWIDAIQRGVITALVVDDLTQICLKSMIEWRQQKPDDKYYAFNQLDLHLDWLAFLLADLGLLCGVSTHMAQPKFDKREKSRTFGQMLAMGAPEVPSSQQLQAVPGWAALVAPIRGSDDVLDPWWPRALSVDPDDAALWVSGDRNSVCWRDTPPSLREVLRAARTPYNLPRVAGYEFQDDCAERVAEMATAKTPTLEIVTATLAHYKDWAPPGSAREVAVQWAIQDGLARHQIRARQRLGVLGRLLPRASAVAPPPPPPVATPAA